MHVRIAHEAVERHGALVVCAQHATHALARLAQPAGRPGLSQRLHLEAFAEVGGEERT